MAAGDAFAQVDLNVGVLPVNKLSAFAYIDAEVVVTPPRAYLRTVGSTRAVQMKQPDGSWWPVRTST
jgi:hypothetical protein